MTNIAEPIYRVLHSQIGSYYHGLQQSQWLSEAELQELQTRKLEKLLAHAAVQVPYYAGKKFPSDPDGTIQILGRLPLLQRADLQAGGEALIARNLSRREMYTQVSGGTTGEPVRFFMGNAQRVISRAYEKRSDYEWTGNLPWSTRKAMLWGQPVRQKKSSVLQTISEWTQRRKKFHLYQASPAEMARQARRLAAYRPGLIMGYSSILGDMAECILQHGIVVRPAAVLATAEMLWEDTKAVIEQAFQCRVYNRYACREFGVIASECPAGNLHINAERFIVEIVKDGQPAAKGDVGDIIVTDLDNFAFPFIRYKLGDIGALSPEPCSCGRKLPVLAKVTGRSGDYIIAPDRTRSMVTILTRVFMNLPKHTVRQTQLVQTRRDHLEIHIIPDEGYTPEFEAHIRQGILNTLRTSAIGLSFHYCDSIAPAPSGKRRFFVSKL